MTGADMGPDAITMQTNADQIALDMVHALRRGDGAAALGLGEAALAAADQRPALLARIHAWMAQAYLQQGKAEAAQTALRSALVLAEQIGDRTGIDALQPLQERVRQGLRSASRPGPPTRGTLPSPDTVLERAVAALDQGRLTEGEALAEDALRAATAKGDHREEVLALLALARLPSRTEAAILEAAGAADRSNDRNLVTAVARAARAGGVSLPSKVF